MRRKRLANRLAIKTDRFYSANDPNEKRKMQIKLIQAGYTHPNALGYFFAARFALAIAFFVVERLLFLRHYPRKGTDQQNPADAAAGATGGYFLPNFQSQ